LGTVRMVSIPTRTTIPTFTRSPFQRD